MMVGTVIKVTKMKQLYFFDRYFFIARFFIFMFG